MDRRVHGVVAAKGRNERGGQALNKAVANADRISLVRVEWSRRVEHPLVILDDGRRNRLTIRAHRRLANMLEDGVRLVAVPRAQLHEDRGANLAEPERQNLARDSFADGR